MFACRSSGERSPIWLQPLNPANDPPPTAQSPSTQTQKPRIETTPSVPGPTVNSTVQRYAEELNTAAVARRDLADTEEFPGTLGFGDPEPLHPNASGVVAGRLPDGCARRRHRQRTSGNTIGYCSSPGNGEG